MVAQRKLAIAIVELIALILALGVSLSSGNLAVVVTLVDTADVWVDDDDPTCSGKQPCFSTIQAAVDALEQGTVHIFPGHYRENVVITKNVSLTGDGAWQHRGVRDLVRLEPRDPLKPTIRVARAGVKTISALEIVAGAVGIQAEDSGIGFIMNVRIVGGGLEAGIRLVRSVVTGILSNEIVGGSIETSTSGIEVEDGYALYISMNSIADVRQGVVIIRQKLVQEILIEHNTFTRNMIHVWLQGQARVQARLNYFANGDTAIWLQDQAWAYIVSNQMVANTMGIWLRDESEASIELNSLLNNLIGIQTSGPDVASGQDWTYSRQTKRQNPRFKITRNQIIGNIIGGILVEGQGRLLRNEITSNGIADPYLYPHPILRYRMLGGMLLSPWIRVEISNNHIENNAQGIVYLSDRFDYKCSRAPVEGEIKGQDNEIKDNEFADLCPPDYPWPPGFRK